MSFLPPQPVTVRSRWLARLLSFLMIVGPGLIVMLADNDAGAVQAYCQAGTQYGTSLLWLLVLLLPVTYFVQEMVVRLGIATGKGHAAMIYQRFGAGWGFFSLFDLKLVNFFTLVTEFAAIDLASRAMGVSPYVTVPLFAVGLVLMVSSGSYRRWEKIALGLCVMDLLWFVYALCLQPALNTAYHGLVPSLPPGGLTADYTFLIIAIVGTTIAPWQLFFQQSCIADKRLRFKDIGHERLETFLGAVCTVSIAGCMMLIGDIARRHGMTHYESPMQMATFLGLTFNVWVRDGLLLLICNAAILGAMAISLASAWAYGEVKGWKSSLDCGWKDAPGFYIVYVSAVALASFLVLSPHMPLALIILSVQVLSGILLPSAIIFLQLLLNDRAVLGVYANTRWNNIVNTGIIIVLFFLSLVLALQVLVPKLFPGGS